MGNTHLQPGIVLDLTAPSGGVVVDQGYLIGAIFAIAQNGPFLVGETFPGAVAGVYQMTKKSAEVWAQGDTIYWDDTAKEASNVSGDQRIGVAVAAALGAAATGDVRLDAVGTGDIATADLVDGSVTLAKTAQFISTEQTGTGAAQNIAHGLGVAPTAVFVAPTDLAPATTGDYTVSEGVHTSTNVIVTVTLSKKFKVLAWA